MTVRKDVRRGKPRWVIEIPYRHRLTGARVRFRKDADVQTSAASHAEERRLIAEYEERGHIRTPQQKRDESAAATPAPCEVTFKQAYDQFMATKAITRLKLTTRMSYVDSARAYLLPRWGQRKLEEVGFVEFEQLDAELKKAGLKASTRAHILTAARSILRGSVDACLLADMPRLPKLPKTGEHVVHPPTAEDVSAILSAAPPHLRLALALCTDAGLRAGEVRGLEWQDVDLRARTLTVRQTIYHGQKDTPKSGHERSVPLTNRLHELLTKAASKPHRLTDLVTVNIHGKVWGQPSLLHAFQTLLRKLGLPRARIHDLRHHFVTEAFLAGGGAPTVRDLAGHKHMHVTARYAHSDEGAKRAVIAALDKRHTS
jgi:integrase